MAVTQSWFQNWNPPQILNDNQPLRPTNHINYLNQGQNQQTYPTSSYSSMVNFLPYFIQMSLVKSGKDGRISVTNSNKKKKPPPPKYYETTGPFKTWYRWKQLDFEFKSESHRESAIFNEEYIPENNLPLGLDVHRNRVFISLPKWKKGIPCTLAVVPRAPKEQSPLLVPYPNWNWHTQDTCSGMVSVFRVQVDSCNRLWVLDSGQIHISIKPEQICSPKILIFDLNTDKLLLRYKIPKEFIKQDSLYSNIIVDIREGDCYDAHAYIADVWRFGLVVFSLKDNRSWRITDHLFYPDPLAAAYNIHNLEFEWTDGIFSLALSPETFTNEERLLYFHPMSSFREFYVKTSIICNETGWNEAKYGFKVLGESRGKLGHASAAGMDRNGILFYNLVSQDSIGCWDSRKPYKKRNLGIVAKNNTSLIFPNDLKIDQEDRSSIWIVTNRLPFYLYKGLDKHDYNFRVMSAYVDEAIQGTVCDPNVFQYDTFNVHESDGIDCR